MSTTQNAACIFAFVVGLIGIAVGVHGYKSGQDVESFKWLAIGSAVWIQVVFMVAGVVLLRVNRD